MTMKEPGSSSSGTGGASLSGPASASNISSTLARRASPSERMVAAALGGVEMPMAIGDPVRHQPPPVNQIIIKKAHYMTQADSKRISASSRGP